MAYKVYELMAPCHFGMEAVLKRLPKSVTIGSGGKEGGG